MILKLGTAVLSKWSVIPQWDLAHRDGMCNQVHSGHSVRWHMRKPSKGTKTGLREVASKLPCLGIGTMSPQHRPTLLLSTHRVEAGRRAALGSLGKATNGRQETSLVHSAAQIKPKVAINSHSPV